MLDTKKYRRTLTKSWVYKSEQNRFIYWVGGIMYKLMNTSFSIYGLNTWICRLRGVFRTPSNIKMELFAKLVNSFQPLTTSAKRSIIDVWQGPWIPLCRRLNILARKRQKSLCYLRSAAFVERMLIFRYLLLFYCNSASRRFYVNEIWIHI